MSNNTQIYNLFIDSGIKVTSSLEQTFSEYLQDSHINVLEQELIYLNATEQLRKDISVFQNVIETIPIITFIFIWVKSVQKDIADGLRKVEGLSALINSNLLKLLEGSQLLNLKSFPEHHIQIENIRLSNNHSIEAKEELIEVYLDFCNWLSRSTFGYIPPAEDNDRLIGKRRKFPFHKYLKLISNLNVRERLLAKLFYLGESPFREEVFSLKLEDVNFDKMLIRFAKGSVNYPSHVFQDLKLLIGNRSKGFVFTNRAGDKIDHTVPYRNFKRVLARLGFDSSLTFNDLSLNL